METTEGAEVQAKGITKAKTSWRQLSLDDMDSLIRIANTIHPDLPESVEVFAERVKLFPQGCLALVVSDRGIYELCGYAISHPIVRLQPPPLNSLLGEISPVTDRYYIHDLAILPKARSLGLAQSCMNELSSIAKRFSMTCLVSVYGSAPFWARFGLVPGETDDVLEQKVRGYGEDAIYLERSERKFPSSTYTLTLGF